MIPRSVSRSTASPRLLAALGLLLLAPACGTAEAEDPMWFTPDDTGAAEEAPFTAWPDRVVMDATTWTLLAVWTTSPPREEMIPMATIQAIQRAQAWEGRPEELVAVRKDGSRILLARGRENVGAAATLLTAVVGRTITDMPPAGEWLEAKREDDKQPRTALALGSVRSGAEVAQTLGDIDPSAAAAQAEGPKTVVMAIDESLPSNADPEALSRAEIQVAIQSQMGPIRTCYQRELMRNPALKGKVVVRFIIEGDGSVTGVRMRESSMGNQPVETCIVDQVAGMTFPKPKPGKVVPVNFPFNFTGT
ncbi:MAG: AgmX/PglI C-terminal domain-containing protein [Alphaproteobacteria bacterium]|nr:AgmX/PglI C-terminal domain-containing protein [Alphaproteobacteria bacterium]